MSPPISIFCCQLMGDALGLHLVRCDCGLRQVSSSSWFWRLSGALFENHSERAPLRCLSETTRNSLTLVPCCLAASLCFDLCLCLRAILCSCLCRGWVAGRCLDREVVLGFGGRRVGDRCWKFGAQDSWALYMFEGKDYVSVLWQVVASDQ
jgi:hypothetical protein